MTTLYAFHNSGHIPERETTICKDCWESDEGPELFHKALQFAADQRDRLTPLEMTEVLDAQCLTKRARCVNCSAVGDDCPKYDKDFKGMFRTLHYN